MSQYFDKDFIKFLLVFLAILALSFILTAAAKVYDARIKGEKARITSMTNNP